MHVHRLVRVLLFSNESIKTIVLRVFIFALSETILRRQVAAMLSFLHSFFAFFFFFKDMCIFMIGYDFVYVCTAFWGWVYIRLYHLTANFTELTCCPYFCVCQGEMPAASPVGIRIQECEAGSTCLGRDTGMALIKCNGG